MSWIMFKSDGSIGGITALAQDLKQEAFVGWTQTQVADDDARIAAHAATLVPVSKPTPLAWFMRLGLPTQAALKIAARTDVTIDLALMYASGVDFVDVTDPLTIQNVQMLQSKNLLTPAEVATLLAP